MSTPSGQQVQAPDPDYYGPAMKLTGQAADVMAAPDEGTAWDWAVQTDEPRRAAQVAAERTGARLQIGRHAAAPRRIPDQGLNSGSRPTS